jgi:hypothetical protein
MSYTAHITKARVSAGGFMLDKNAFAKLKSGTVQIILGPKSTNVLTGTVKRLSGLAQGYCYCRELYRTTAGTIVAPLPLKLGDKLEYEIGTGNIRLLSIRRTGSVLSPPPVPAESPRQHVTSGLKTPSQISSYDNECEILACRFIEKLMLRERAVDLTDENDWLNGAFVASAGRENQEGAVLGINAQTRQKIEIIITDFLWRLSVEVVCGQSGFEWLFARGAHQIEDAVSIHSPETWFSFGRAQKVLNIVIKYCYAWWLCKRINSPKFGDLSWIDKWAPYLHVPVDRETIKHLNRDSTYRILVHERGNSTLISWTRRMDKFRYLRIQDAIRRLAQSQNVDPICYEMKYIWTA